VPMLTAMKADAQCRTRLLRYAAVGRSEQPRVGQRGYEGRALVGPRSDPGTEYRTPRPAPRHAHLSLANRPRTIGGRTRHSAASGPPSIFFDGLAQPQPGQTL
jgi:hypothetical protein